MSTIPYKEIPHNAKVRVVRWDNLTNGDEGESYMIDSKCDKSVQVFGFFDAGGNATIEGSNDALQPNYAILKDPQGNILQIAYPKIEKISECSLKIRPRVKGSAKTNLSVLIIFASSTI